MHKRPTRPFNTVRFNPKKQIMVEGRERKQVKITSSADWENLDDDVEINRIWETIRRNITISDQRSLGYTN
jgi:hypothetical protein